MHKLNKPGQDLCCALGIAVAAGKPSCNLLSASEPPLPVRPGTTIPVLLFRIPYVCTGTINFGLGIKNSSSSKETFFLLIGGEAGHALDVEDNEEEEEEVEDAEENGCCF